MAVMNATQVVRFLKCSPQKAKAVLEYAGVKPVFETDNLKLYDRDTIKDVRDKVMARYEAVKHQEASERILHARTFRKAPEPGEAPAAAPDGPTLAGVSEKLDRIIQLLETSHAATASVAEQS